MGKKRKALPEPVEALIEDLTHDGRGLTHVGGKAVFVHGALPGERVRLRYTRVQRRYDEGVVDAVLTPSPQRVTPRCASFGVCGGCSLQHMDSEAQIQAKQAILQDVLRRIGKVEPMRWLEPLTAGEPVQPEAEPGSQPVSLQDQHWGYRRKARLGVRWVAKKGRVLVGFRERGSAFIADTERCEVLHPSVGTRLSDLAQLIEGLDIRERLPQIEVAQGDGPVVLVFRVLDPPSDADIARLQAFGTDNGFHVYLQEGGVDTVRPLPGQAIDLYYSLPRHQVRIGFDPTDFTQVNLELNRRMVDQALALLDVQPDEQVLDLFCGLGNFTLPIARQARLVVGVEGDEGLVRRARANAERNAIHNVDFHSADLYGDLEPASWRRQRFDKVLLDPPRSGAREVLDLIADSGASRLVYVSCYPSTLARDADYLVNGLGFRLLAAGAMDMFPHTAHLESMALFER
ncbi:23S rRNA (uracil(1939)-C(5))-methyltransferase RlmD [Thiohalocapsa marina]|uniref:23S rRNA (uracil(1939)-C(5))-methyltransferase RlmD n=1 Tax=Thiohalocapsa marina TaxID=424902 RepID=A0A5M8FQU5_9GAMM|nr:23S rRNA (uracil(1939)-C(5))-methyltransferase RlmD [Thiohalocapsa marina]KAA6185631.1 23S rRNA (uracil(1939)-C(5))-methyltransferase RlmD [Thiohalocapsa marina]